MTPFTVVVSTKRKEPLNDVTQHGSNYGFLLDGDEQKISFVF